VALLDKARAALAAGDTGDALRTVDDYDARFPGGSLWQEATVLRIEALLHQGKQREAADLADRFLGSQPKSPYAAKIRGMLDAQPVP
jgi:outer membrane protein assembly factor BamD (BamD/ComL family)